MTTGRQTYWEVVRCSSKHFMCGKLKCTMLFVHLVQVHMKNRSKTVVWFWQIWTNHPQSDTHLHWQRTLHIWQIFTTHVKTSNQKPKVTQDMGQGHTRLYHLHLDWFNAFFFFFREESLNKTSTCTERYTIFKPCLLPTLVRDRLNYCHHTYMFSYLWVCV